MTTKAEETLNGSFCLHRVASPEVGKAIAVKVAPKPVEATLGVDCSTAAFLILEQNFCNSLVHSDTFFMVNHG